MPGRLLVALLSLFAVLLAAPRAARANGRFPASNAVIFSPGSDEDVLVRVTFGLLASRDGARSWRWICERAIGFSGLEDPSYVVTKNGVIVAGLFDGIRVSRDRGCTWEPVSTDARVFVDLTSRGDGAIVALASSYDRHTDAGSLYRSQLFLSTDDARSFSPLGTQIDPTLLAESVEVAPSDPKRIYVSAVRGDDAARTGVVLVSSDGGARWTERAIELLPRERAPFIAAVDAQIASTYAPRLRPTARPACSSPKMRHEPTAGCSARRAPCSASRLLRTARAFMSAVRTTGSSPAGSTPRS